MLSPRMVAMVFLVDMMVLGAGVVCSQDYPNRPIRIISNEPGGSNDFSARFIAQGITGPLGQTVIVENRPSRLIGGIASKALPDGYTLVVTSSSLWQRPLLREVDYDPVKDFSPVALVSRAPNLLVVHPSMPANSVKELIALAKAKPGALSYPSGGPGSTQHLTTELFRSMAGGINIVHIPYKGGAGPINGLMGGEVQLSFESTTSVVPYVKSNRLRALAVTSVQSSALMPGLPTVAASLPGFEATSMTAMFAPTKTPVAIISRLNRETVRVLETADAKEKYLNLGAETVGSSPAELAATMKSEMGRMGKVIKDAGIRAE